MTRKERNLLNRIIIALALFLALLPLHYIESVLEAIPPAWRFWVELGAFLVPYLIVGHDILYKAGRNILRGKVFDENFLMTLATIGAFCLGEYPEAVAVMLFYQVGELFQSRAVSKSRRSIAELMDIRPDYANIMRNGVLEQVDPEEVHVGDTIVVKPGERIPLDGVVEEGTSVLDTSALTGESVPRDVSVGSAVMSGCINKTGLLTIRVESEFGQSTVSKILELVETASDKKSRSEQFITRFARYYTPAVVIAAVIIAVLPPLITAQAFSVWVSRALTFLVISCPCALVISVPLSFFGGIGGASKSGVLVKGSNYLEALANTEIVVFDKTGTLTKGSFAVSEIAANGISRDELLELAAHAEGYSDHPIAKSIREAYPHAVDMAIVEEVEEIAGHGVRANIKGREVLAGNARLMQTRGINYDGEAADGTVVHLAVDGSYAGYIRVEDELKPDAVETMHRLKEAGVKKTVMLTGDNDAVGRRVAATLGLDEVYTELLPADKVEKVEELMQKKSAKGMLAFVGDGINDAPVLARADIGIAMGGLGSDAAIEAADIVIMTDEPGKIVTAVNISRKTLRIVRQNIVFALGVKAIVLVLGAMGIASMWAAVFADVGVSVIAILNAIRALKVDTTSPEAITEAAIPKTKEALS